MLPAAAGAIMALLQHMMKQPGGEVCHNHIFILSSRLASSPRLQQVMQVTQNGLKSIGRRSMLAVACLQTRHFVAEPLASSVSARACPRLPDWGGLAYHRSKLD